MILMRAIFTNFLRSHAVLRLLFIIFLFMILFGIIMHFIEPAEFPTIFDGIWWVVVTCSTVGFGDYVPASIVGRSVAIFLILSGAGFFTFYMVTLATALINTINAFNEGSATYKGKEHVIIIGWNERAKKTMEQLLKIESSLNIVLIDETLEKNPYDIHNIHFIKGKPSQDETLIKGNIKSAEMVLITADQHKSEHDADTASIITLLAIKGLKPSIYSIIEILTPEQVNNAKRAGANELIETNMLSSYLMIDSLISPGISTFLVSILDQLTGSKITFIPVPDTCINSTFYQGLQYFLKEEMILIGIKKGEESIVNPPLSLEIHKDDQLLIIKH